MFYVKIYTGEKYLVMIYYEGDDNGEFVVYNREKERDVVVIDGLTEYETFKLRDVLDNVKDIDDWVNTTFEMDKPINGKHAFEFFVDKLCKVISCEQQ
jgi:hypothetical protein